MYMYVYVYCIILAKSMYNYVHIARHNGYIQYITVYIAIYCITITLMKPV